MGDQANIFKLIYNSLNTSVHLKVDDEQSRIVRESERQAGESRPFARYLSRLRHVTSHITQMLLIRKT